MGTLTHYFFSPSLRSQRDKTEMYSVFCRVFCCSFVTISEDADVNPPTPLPTYEEATRQNSPSRNRRSHPHFSPLRAALPVTTASRRPGTIVQYNSYMAAVAYPPRLDPLTRLSSRRPRARRRRSGDSDFSMLSADSGPRDRWVDRRNQAPRLVSNQLLISAFSFCLRSFSTKLSKYLLLDPQNVLDLISLV